MITVKVPQNEINRIAEKAQRFRKKTKLEVATELARSAYRIDANAKARLQRRTTNFGFLAANMRVEKLQKDGLVWDIASTANYSAYVEFGTGRLVDLKDLVRAGFPESFALQFKGKGVKKINLPPQKFFFGTIANEQPKLLSRLRETLKRNGKNF